MSEFLQYWWHCLQIGWEIGGGIFEKIEFGAALFSAGLLWHRKWKKIRGGLEEIIMKGAFGIFLIAFLISTFFIAPFIHEKESTGITQAQALSIAELQKQLADKSPKLDGFINQYMFSDDPGTTNILVFLQVEVGNSGGSASIAENYNFTVILTNAITIEASPIDFSDEFTWKTLSGNMLTVYKLTRAELISEKTSVAVQPGENPRGWLAYKLPRDVLWKFNQTNLVLSFMDVSGKKISVTNGIWKGKPASKIENYAGSPKSFPSSVNLIETNIDITTYFTSGPWLPPELAPGDTNVIIYFGNQSLVYSKWQAEVPLENVAEFSLTDLPDDVVENAKKTPGFSWRIKQMGFRRSDPVSDVGGVKVNYPVIPLVVSNRLYVEVEIPFLDKKRKVVMSDEFDSELSIPNAWDRNYSTNRNYCVYEIVNDQTNPVLQVFYTKENEVHVNGIFVVNTNLLLASFGGPPSMFDLVLGTNPPPQNLVYSEMLPLNTNQSVNEVNEIISNSFYHPKFPYQKAIFKYPSYKYLGVFDAGTGK